MKYENYQQNHVIVPGREDALATFLDQTHQGVLHKRKNAVNSNSEDALTWSCFDALASFPGLGKAVALDELLDDAFSGNSPLSFCKRGISDHEIAVCVGKQYAGITTAESTEVDASIEAPGVLVFVEAKLYSAVSPLVPSASPHDQIARKLRIGLDSVVDDEREFYFVFLDLAPAGKLLETRPNIEGPGKAGSGYKDKWRSASIYWDYKEGSRNSWRALEEALVGVSHPPAETVAARMGWLTWSDLFKCTLRAVMAAKS